MDRSPELLDAAQLLRRTSLRVDHAAVQNLAGRQRGDVLDQVLNPSIDQTPIPAYENTDQVLVWWTEKLAGPNSGLHERMTFFWHTLLTTNRYSGDEVTIARQIELFRTHALGNYRDLLQAFVVDAALIQYLNANGSTAENPNENLSRELMELFTFGIGNYTQADVQAGALAMAGWTTTKDEDWAVKLDPERQHNGQVTFLGETRNWDLPQIVDRLCDDQRTAERIASKVWYHFIGTELESEQQEELGAWWVSNDLEIMPLLDRIVRDPAMQATHYGRPRSGFEFYAAVYSVLDLDAEDTWVTKQMGQGLYEPPNVAGWPDDRWLTPDSMLRRAYMISGMDFHKVDRGLEIGSNEILDRCGIYTAEQNTLDALNQRAFEEDHGEEGKAHLQWRIALSCPEFQLT